MSNLSIHKIQVIKSPQHQRTNPDMSNGHCSFCTCTQNILHIIYWSIYFHTLHILLKSSIPNQIQFHYMSSLEEKTNTLISFYCEEIILNHLSFGLAFKANLKTNYCDLENCTETNSNTD